eukprot:SAG11_NODE_3403_length_2468_cov_3.115287_2_plen_108_part_01
MPPPTSLMAAPTSTRNTDADDAAWRARRLGKPGSSIGLVPKAAPPSPTRLAPQSRLSPPSRSFTPSSGRGGVAVSLLDMVREADVAGVEALLESGCDPNGERNGGKFA